MEIKTYDSHGRKLLVEFTCFRCGITTTRPLEDCMNDAKEYYRELYDLTPPKDWQDGGFYYPMFCPKCAKEYKQFMNNER